MQKVFRLMVFAAVTVLISSCSTIYKQVPYLQNSDNYVANTAGSDLALYDARIMPKDLITITVNTSDQSAAIPFNLTVPTPFGSTSSSTLTSQPSLQKYLVDNDGIIRFPIIGELEVAGLTKGEVEELIVDKLKRYLKETPIVSVRMTNYNISVLGEVTSPGTFTIDNEKVTIFEALAMAKDMTIYGLRENIKLIREDATGERRIIQLDITDPNIIASPYYYLQQNDVVYVTPNDVKARTSGISTSTTIWFSVVSSVVSLATLLVTILL